MGKLKRIRATIFTSVPLVFSKAEILPGVLIPTDITDSPANSEHLLSLFIAMVWSAISKIIPWAKVNSICHMSIVIHVASKNVCAMPKSIYNMGN